MLGLLLLYFLLILLLPKLFSRPFKTLGDYFLAGRQLRVWPVAITFVASWFGAASTIGTLNTLHQNGISGLWHLVLPSVLSCLVITLFFARRVCRLQSLSQPEAVETHYGKTGRFLLSWIILASSTAFIGSQLVAGGKLMQAVLALDDKGLATVAMAVVVMTYTMLGGYWAVVITDMAQFVFFTAAMLILFGLSVLTVMHAGSFPALLTTKASAVSSVASLFASLFSHWPDDGFLTLSFVLAWCIAPEMWQRMSSLPQPRQAIRAAALATLLLAGLFVLTVSTGLLSPLLVQANGNVLLDLANQLPVGLKALVIAGTLAAVGSTMDSALNVGSLTLTHDLYQGFIKPRASQDELLWVSRLTTALMMLPACLIALRFEDIIHVLWLSADIYASAMFVPIVGILYLKQPGRLSGVWAMTAGGLIAGLTTAQELGIITLPDWWPHAPYSTLLGVLFSAIAFAAGYYCYHSFRLNNAQTDSP